MIQGKHKNFILPSNEFMIVFTYFLGTKELNTIKQLHLMGNQLLLSAYNIYL